jgi:hypothetical protein
MELRAKALPAEPERTAAKEMQTISLETVSILNMICLLYSILVGDCPARHYQIFDSIPPIHPTVDAPFSEDIIA